MSPRQRDGRAQPETVPLQELELWGRVLLENLNRAPRVGSNQHCQRFICRRWLRHPRDGMNGRNLVHHDQVRCERMEGVYIPNLCIILRIYHYSDEWTSSIGHREETTIGTQGEMRDGEEHVLLEQLRKVDFSRVINPLGIPSPDSELHASSSEYRHVGTPHHHILPFCNGKHRTTCPLGFNTMDRNYLQCSITKRISAKSQRTVHSDRLP